MKTAYEAVLHTSVIAPILALTGGIAIVCLACAMCSEIGDHLAGERPWRKPGYRNLRLA